MIRTMAAATITAMATQSQRLPEELVGAFVPVAVTVRVVEAFAKWPTES